MREAKENGVAIINTGSDEAVDEDRNDVFGEGRVQIGNVLWIAKCGW